MRTTRAVVGIVGIVLILAIAAERCVAATSDRQASAIQVTQIYTEGAFALIVVLGLVIAFYVAVRPD